LKVTASLLFVGTICVAIFPTYAQRCPQVGVLYVVRNEAGEPLNDAELKMVIERLPNTIGALDSTTETYPAKPNISSVGINEDGSLRSHPYFETPRKTVEALSLMSGGCRLQLRELTVELGGKSMRLRFDIDVDSKKVRILVVDSLPFQEGTFALMTPRATQTVVPAQQWMKVSP